MHTGIHTRAKMENGKIPDSKKLKIFMNKIILFVFLVFESAFATAITVSVWTSENDSFLISREAVSIPSVRILDDVRVHFYSLKDKIGSPKVTADELKTLSEVGDLKAEEQPFLQLCNTYILVISEHEYFIIYDEIDTKRYCYAKAVKQGGLILQRGALQMCTSRMIPKAVIDLVAENEVSGVPTNK